MCDCVYELTGVSEGERISAHMNICKREREWEANRHEYVCTCVHMSVPVYECVYAQGLLPIFRGSSFSSIPRLLFPPLSLPLLLLSPSLLSYLLGTKCHDHSPILETPGNTLPSLCWQEADLQSPGGYGSGRKGRVAPISESWVQRGHGGSVASFSSSHPKAQCGNRDERVIVHHQRLSPHCV